jgi:hypothetical protein
VPSIILSWQAAAQELKAAAALADSEHRQILR